MDANIYQQSMILTCNLTLETSDCAGNCVIQKVYKNASLSLLRNELRELVLMVDTVNSSMKFVLRDLILHKRFAKEGKGGIQLPDQSVKFLLSNCASSQLIRFLKTLGLKFINWKQAFTDKSGAGAVNCRKQIMLNVQRTLTEISPLTASDVNINASNSNKRPLGENVNGANMCGKQQTSTPIRGLKRQKMSNEPNYSCNENCVRPSRPRTSLFSVGLTEQQTRVLNAVLSGKNVFFTGGAGTGKSLLLKKIVQALPSEVTFVTASTGVAASHIGGTTLHAFAGIGSGSATLQQCVATITSRGPSLQQWKKCETLIIDEISMVDGEYFSKIEKVARLVRKNGKPFGGIQVVLCGDFFQLPPVQKDGEKRTFCFQANAWDRCVEVCLELEKVHRQTDPKFVSILSSIRIGRCTDKMCAELMATAANVLERGGILATHLCSHNDDAKELNERQLDKLSGEKRVFAAVDSEPTLSKWLNNQCPVESTLVLKVGTQVMLLKNVDVQRGLVNGARGVVLAFDSSQESLPVVKFFCGVKTVVKYERWLIRASRGVQLTRKQVPLKLAWAISIHKAQGMTLDCVEMSLSKIFECGQAYVALSRAKSLDGLRVLDFNRQCVRARPEVMQFYSSFSGSNTVTFTN